AVDEALRLEGRIGVLDGAQATVEVGAGLGEGVDGDIGVGRRLAGGALARQRHDVLGCCGRILGVAAAAGGIGIEGRPLAAGAAAEHVAELVEDHHRRDQKENRAEIEETHIRANHSLSPPAWRLLMKAYRTRCAIIQIKAEHAYLTASTPAASGFRHNRQMDRACALPSSPFSCWHCRSWKSPASSLSAGRSARWPRPPWCLRPPSPAACCSGTRASAPWAAFARRWKRA